MISRIISNPLIFHLIIAVSSLAILAKSADMVVFSSSDYAKKLGISDYLIGFLVISVGTAIPELTASITSILMGQGSIVFGTVLGSNLFEIPLLGIILLMAKETKVKQSKGMSAPIVTLFIVVFPILLTIDGVLSRMDGILLIIAFIIYISRLWRGEGKRGKMKEDIPIRKIWKDSIIFCLALASLLLSSRFLVFSSINLSKILNISPYVIGLLVIGIGASAPELTIQVKSVLKHHKDIAFGNVLGSLVANSSLVLGIVAIIKPVYISSKMILVTSIFLISSVTYVLVIMGKDKVTWKHGLILILFYMSFLVAEFVF
ncbi:hypothetical protein KY358_05000 [Candidatus Woesearchaeota archaeon]|nr:hypothetical protein [Candidatus Woesearchaeota archaeon]